MVNYWESFISGGMVEMFALGHEKCRDCSQKSRDNQELSVAFACVETAMYLGLREIPSASKVNHTCEPGQVTIDHSTRSLHYRHGMQGR